MMDSCSDETVYVIYVNLRKFKNDKTYKEKIVKDIIPVICAMLNSNGGKVKIPFDNSVVPVEGSSRLNIKPDILDDKNSLPQISLVIRVLEQKIISIIGQSQTVSKINFSYDKDIIVIRIQRADSLITANYNLNVPSHTQVMEVSPWEPLENIKNNIFYREATPNAVELGSHCQVFLKDKKCGFHESKISQFKNLKAISSKCTSLADRITGKGNKFSRYVSAFANHSGGHVYYGITDEGVVEGEFIEKEKGMEEIIKKVEKGMNKIIWPEQIDQPKRGEQWEIFFEPVVGANSKPVPSTFVVVIYIAPCLGGVFADVPECYEMVDEKVSKMSFAIWKKRVFEPVCLRTSWRAKNIPHSAQRITWSSDAIRKVFTINDCDELRKIVKHGYWEIFGNECNNLENQSDLRETIDLVILFKRITACKRKGEFKDAHILLEDYKALSLKVQDSFIFEVLGLYLEAALKRASGDLKALKEPLTKALSKAERIQPGLVTATVYIFAATVSDLINLGSPASLTEKALEHLDRVPDFSDVLAAMRRKANIILATFHLGCNVSGQALKDSINIVSLEKAMTCIKATYESAYEEHPLNVYYDIQLYLVLSIFKYRRSQLVPGLRERELRNACRYAKKAQRLAHTNKFTEMFKWSKNIETLCTQALNHVRNDKSDQRSEERMNQPEHTSRGDRVEQDQSSDRRKSCDLRNRTEQVGRQDQKEQDNLSESSKTKPKSTDPQKVYQSQNPHHLNVERDSQVKTKNEETLFCADMGATSTAQESKARDYSVEQAQPQRDSVSPLSRQNKRRTPTHQNSPNVSLIPTLPETSSYIMNNADMLMHVPYASSFEGSVSSGCYTGTSPVGSQRFSDSSFRFDHFPNGSFQVQVPVQQLPPPTYPFESTHRAQAPNYLIAKSAGNQPVVLVNHPGPMMMRPLMATGRGARFPYGMPEPIQTSPYQCFSRQQRPASQLQRQQQTRRQHKKHWRKK